MERTIKNACAAPSASSFNSVATLPGTSSITLPDHCFQNAETVQTFLSAWSNVMVAREQSRASVVASTCELLSTRAKAQAQTDCTKASCARDIITTKTTELGKTTRTKEECATTRECRRLQRDEVIQGLHKNPWQNFTNAITLFFGLSTVSKLARRGLVVPTRGIRMLLAFLIVILMSRSAVIRRLVMRFMFWRYPRFSSKAGCKVSLDGRKISFIEDTEVRVLPPRGNAKSPLALNFIGRRFQAGLTDGIRYWMLDAPLNGKIRVLDPDSKDENSLSVGAPKVWGVLLDIEQKAIYLTIDRNVDRLCFSKDDVTSNVVWPIVRGFAGEDIELVH